MQVEYSQKGITHRFIRKVLALPFLPEEQITETFNTLKDTVDTEKITKLMEYINNTWINGSTWKPASWTVYRQSVRTSNDLEGWHHRINRKAQKPNLQMYILIVLLHKEARLLPTQLKMVTEVKLRRYQRKKPKELQHRIFALWYSEEEITVNQLLKKCCKIYGGQ